MTTPPIIGIMGLKRSGKDTYATRLVEVHGYTLFALADPMREVALALDPIVDVSEWTEAYDAANHGVDVTRLSTVVAVFGWDYAKETYPEVRRTLQRLGTEAGRGVFGEDFWVNETARRMSEVSTPIVITDIRFPNEYRWIKSLGGTLVRVIRPGTEAGAHSSEAMASDLHGFPADATALNNSSVADLHDHADILARVLRR